jgi:hypothetical protein
LRAQTAWDNTYALASHVCSNAHDEPGHASVNNSSLLTPHTTVTELTAPACGSGLRSVVPEGLDSAVASLEEALSQESLQEQSPLDRLNSHIRGLFLNSSTATGPHEIASCHTTLPSTIFRQQPRRSRGKVTCIYGETNE